MAETPRVFLDAEALTEIRRNTDWAGLLSALGIACDPRRSKADEVWAHSPFAVDKRASFHVTPKGWYCFATGQGGGVLELVQKELNLSCYEAARWLLDNGLSSYTGEIPAAVLEPRREKAVNQFKNECVTKYRCPAAAQQEMPTGKGYVGIWQFLMNLCHITK